MWVRVLGSAAGGGVPQWNCACPNCAAARAGSPDVPARTQSSAAVSADGKTWFLLNVSPDVRQQLLAFPDLGPAAGRTRGTAIGGCIVTDAELDHTLGLLLLREGEQLGITSTAAVRRWLHEDFPVGPVLASFCERSWCDMVPDVPFEPGSPQQGASGLRVRAFDVGGHAPRYVRTSPTDAAGAVVGLEIEDLRSGGKLVYAPCLGSFSDRLAAAVAAADCVLLDGTFWDNDELLRAGGARTALQTGHWPVGGAAGSLAWLAHLPVRHRVYVHINNTNPMLRLGSPERHQVESAGVRVGMDGDEFHL